MVVGLDSCSGLSASHFLEGIVNTAKSSIISQLQELFPVIKSVKRWEKSVQDSFSYLYIGLLFSNTFRIRIC